MESLPFDRSCPECHAKAGETCKNESGAVIRGVHTERWPKKNAREEFNHAAARLVTEATKD